MEDLLLDAHYEILLDRAPRIFVATFHAYSPNLTKNRVSFFLTLIHLIAKLADLALHCAPLFTDLLLLHFQTSKHFLNHLTSECNPVLGRLGVFLSTPVVVVIG